MDEVANAMLIFAVCLVVALVFEAIVEFWKDE